MFFVLIVLDIVFFAVADGSLRPDLLLYYGVLVIYFKLWTAHGKDIFFCYNKFPLRSLVTSWVWRPRDYHHKVMPLTD